MNPIDSITESRPMPTPAAPGFIAPGSKVVPTVFGPGKINPVVPAPAAANPQPVEKNEFSVNTAIKAQGHLTEAEKRGVEIIPKLLQSYFRIIRRKIEDTVPKACVAFLV